MSPVMPNLGTASSNRAFLIAMTAMFSILALDIAFPALVLSIMALSRWLVLADIRLPELKGTAA